MNLLWLDLETTGLDPAKGNILEIGYRIFQKEISIALPCDIDDMPLHEIVREMHTSNGLGDVCRALIPKGVDWYAQHEFELEKAEEAILIDINNEFGTLNSDESTHVYLAGSSIHFDKKWIEFHMPKLNARLHYRLFDVSGICLFCQWLGMPKPEERKEKPHRALADIQRSVELMEHCTSWLLHVGSADFRRSVEVMKQCANLLLGHEVEKK